METKNKIAYKDSIENDLNNKGFAIFDFLNDTEIGSLKEIVYKLGSEADHDDVHVKTPFRLSAFNNSYDWKEAIYKNVFDLLKEKLETLLVNYEPLVVNIFEKLPNTGDNSVAIHQNPSFVTEPEYKSVSLWIPLIDVNKSNGTLGVLKGSHDVFDKIRTANMPDVFENVTLDLQNDWFEPINISCGQVALLDDSLIHWSYPNISQETRTAVQLICVPKNTRHIYSYYDTSTERPKINLYDVNKDFFFKFNCKSEPIGLNQFDSFDFEYINFSKNDFYDKLKERNGKFSNQTTSQNIKVRQSAIFKDEEQQLFFENNGYVKIPVLSEYEIQDLRNFHSQNKIPVEDGFSTTFGSTDSGLKKLISEKILSVLEKKGKEILLDYQPVYGTFICKSKNSERHITLHQDWSFVEEGKGNISLNLWCPLVETNSSNGMLYVLPGSHKISKIPRVAEVTDNLDEKFLEGYSHLIQSLPTKLGEAIIFDQALFHGSQPNTTEYDRLAVGVLCLPKNSNLMFYYQTEQGLERRQADLDFFIKHNPFVERPEHIVEMLPPLKKNQLREEFIKVFGMPQEQKPKIVKKSWLKRLFNN